MFHMMVYVSFFLDLLPQEDREGKKIYFYSLVLYLSTQELVGLQTKDIITEIWQCKMFLP